MGTSVTHFFPIMEGRIPLRRRNIPVGEQQRVNVGYPLRRMDAALVTFGNFRLAIRLIYMHLFLVRYPPRKRGARLYGPMWYTY